MFSFFLPLLLFGDIFETQAAEAPRRTYRPTAAQLRLEKQHKEQAARIQAIRRQAAGNAGNAQRKAVAAVSAGKQIQPIRYMWYKSNRFFLVHDIARYYGMTVHYLQKGVMLKSPRDTIVLHYEKRLASVNQVSVYLTHAPILRGALVYLDEKDFQLVIDPVVRNAPLWKHPLKTILIDPGHGGKDQGAPGVNGLLEKNVTLTLAHKLALRLRKSGYRVFMTRIGDRNLTLQQRVDMCGKLKPDLFISVHCNAVANKKTQGIETYAATPQGAASTSDSKPVQQASAGNSFNRNNYRLAYEVQKNLLGCTKAEDRGVRHARFFVIRHAACPAILIETGFLTHPKEGPLLNADGYQDKLVDGIVLGISAYAKAAAAMPVNRFPVMKTSAAVPGRKK
ncbi:MAG: N-acetylmuramoyl-L-alanine amidase [Lentisphaeria bacterium]|nr:N-acetylmuramoyl-L-alanine amidase [Lentisphaeria bacterium]